MSTFWTPEGERPIRRDPPPAGDPAPSGPDGEELSPEDEAALTQLQEQLAETPVELVIANHAFGLFELAALHLSLQPPQLRQARVAIDALGALVEGMAGKLGEYERQLVEGLANLRMAYVQIRSVAQGEVPGAGGPASAYPGPPAK
jgi:Domain of unknown function (DUF1844)